MPRRPSAAVVLLTLALGCGAGKPAPAETPAPAHSRELVEQTRSGVGRAMAQPDVDRAFSEAFEKIGQDPAVGRAGSELMSSLGDDPAIGKSAEVIIQRLGRTRELQQLILEFQARHPQSWEAEIDRHMDRAFESPAIDAALDRATDELMERPAIVQANDDLSSALLASGEVETAFSEAFLSAVERAARGRLSATIGAAPGDARYERALADYLTEPERLGRLLVAFARVFGEHPAPRRAIVTILSSPAMRRLSLPPARGLLADPDFVDRSVRAMLAVVLGRDQSEVDRHVRDVVMSPAAEQAMATWMSSLATAPELVSALARAFAEVASSPELSAEIERIYFSQQA